MQDIQEYKIDLCVELLKVMGKMNFLPTSISHVEGNEWFQKSVGCDPLQQRTQLVIMFYNYLMYTGDEVPVQIRLALGSATDSKVWLDDVVANILPWMRNYQERYFPVTH